APAATALDLFGDAPAQGPAEQPPTSVHKVVLEDAQGDARMKPEQPYGGAFVCGAPATPDVPPVLGNGCAGTPRPDVPWDGPPAPAGFDIVSASLTESPTTIDVELVVANLDAKDFGGAVSVNRTVIEKVCWTTTQDACTE